MAQWKSICLEQFQLSYYGNISYESIENMSSYERKYFYSLLVEQKTTEKELAEEQAKKLTSK